MFITNYYVLEKETERTVAICSSEKDAEIIANFYPIPCIVRVSIVRRYKNDT